MMLNLLLRILGGIIAVAARFNPRIRAQLGQRRVIEIRVADGPAGHFVFAERGVRTVSGRASAADATLVFASTGQAVRTLISPQLPSRLMAGLQHGSIHLEGEALLLLWFMGLAHQVYPVLAALRLPATPPDSYISPSASESVSRRITRLGVADDIDPELKDELTARAELRMMRGAHGEILRF